MDEKLSLKERYNKEKEKFRNMDSAARSRYFKDYYLIPCLLILGAIIAISWFSCDVFSSKKTVYSGATVGFLITDEGNEYLTTGFINSLGKSYKRKKAELSRDTVMTTYEEAKSDSQSFELAFTSQVTTGMFQYVLFTRSAFDHYAGYDFFMSLDEYLDSGKYASLDFLSGADGKAAGIVLPDKVKKNIGYNGEDDIVFTLVYSDEHTSLNPDFIDYLFNGGDV